MENDAFRVSIYALCSRKESKVRKPRSKKYHSQQNVIISICFLLISRERFFPFVQFKCIEYHVIHSSTHTNRPKFFFSSSLLEFNTNKIQFSFLSLFCSNDFVSSAFHSIPFFLLSLARRYHL